MRPGVGKTLRIDALADKGQPVLKVTRTFVKTGDRFDNRVAVLTGLTAGDKVAASGQLKLSNGAVVVINDSESLKTPAVVPTN